MLDLPEPPPTPGFDRFLERVQENILMPIITLLALAAFILFVFGVMEFVMNAADEEKRRSGRQHMMWGIIGLAILFGARIIVTILGSIVGNPR